MSELCVKEIKLIAEHLVHYERLDAAFEKLDEALGCTADSPLFKAVWECFEDHTKVVAQLVGDREGWIEWYVRENECGAKGMAAGYDGVVMPVKTLSDLVRLIEIGRARA